MKHLYGNDVYDYAEDVISHSGRKGMKWGVRNGPPYPLDKNPAKQAKKKAAYEEDKIRGGFTSNLKKKLKQVFRNKSKEKKDAAYDWLRKVSDSHHEAEVNRHVPSDIKKRLFSPIKDDYETLLTKEEKRALHKYTADDYKPMNEILRHDKVYKNPKAMDELRNQISDATSALEKMRLPEDVFCHRGIGRNPENVASILNIKPELLSKPKALQSLIDNGLTFTDKGFYSSGASIDDTFGGTTIHTFVSKGSKGMYVDPISSHKGEHEILLQRNSTFLVKSFKTNKKGDVITDLYVEVVDQVLPEKEKNGHKDSEV